jgi:hypothetical protein
MGGGTAVSRPTAKYLAREPDSKAETGIELSNERCYQFSEHYGGLGRIMMTIIHREPGRDITRS